MTPLRQSDVVPVSRRVYDACDRAGGFLLLSIVASAPWLFGATENWSIRLLNGLAGGAGLLTALKWWLRWRSGAVAVEGIWQGRDERLQPGAWMIRAMAVLTFLVLCYCLVSALNARATFHPETRALEYHRYVPFLPFTYDSALTWQTFWNYLALAILFWGLRDWLIHPPRAIASEADLALGLPPRFRTLFWLIAINSTALALQGLFQQLQGSNRLLWIREPYDSNAGNMFGPFAFRGNAAQYFNLAWPAILGFWWMERERARLSPWANPKVGGGSHLFLLLCAVITAAAPLFAASQGGALVSFLLLGATALVFVLQRGATWQSRVTVLFVCGAVLALGGALGWDQLAPRLREIFRTPYANPNELYENARQMALDYPLFGIGPGAFRALYHLYRDDPSQPWQAFLHDDWLETRVTFGWAGSMLLLTLLGLALARWFVHGGIPARLELVAMIWIGIGGCLAHAKFSFPLQVYSILTLLLVQLAVLSALSRPEK